MVLGALLAIRVDELVGERTVLLVQRRRRSIIGWVLGVAAMVERLWVLSDPTNRRFVLIGSIVWLLFFSYVTWTQLRSLLKQREVDHQHVDFGVSAARA